MRLLTHNTLKNNTADAKGKGFPLRITASEIKVHEGKVGTGEGAGGCVMDDDERKIAFCKNVLPMLDWNALIKAAQDMGMPPACLPPVLTQELAENDEFLKALYHVLMDVHLVQGMLTCPATGREFPVLDGIPNMMIQEDECEPVRY